MKMQTHAFWMYSLKREYIKNVYRLIAWEEVKPKLFHGACPYASTLIINMIQILVTLEKVNGNNHRKSITVLKRMLRRFPPPTSPSQADSFLLQYLSAVLESLARN
jgi:hypothetical protein